jgi:hypothetical protein
MKGKPPLWPGLNDNPGNMALPRDLPLRRPLLGFIGASGPRVIRGALMQLPPAGTRFGHNKGRLANQFEGDVTV